ncbi:MAG: hypothetical protein JWM09_300 [Francisellaceae bacterium]|nr:hypothetical protein [Francisellaceae bacterium]
MINAFQSLNKKQNLYHALILINDKNGDDIINHRAHFPNYLLRIRKNLPIY